MARSAITISSLVCLILLPLARTKPASADQLNEKTYMTFSQPVEIPGHVLSPGTYVFKLIDSRSDRNIVQILSQNETHVYATLLTVPDYRFTPRGKTVINFEERTSGSPEAVQAWFFPGDNYGHEFVYPSAHGASLAGANNRAVLSTRASLSNSEKSGSNRIVQR